MILPENPFLTAGYHSPSYFCDREIETKKLCNALINGRNLTLLSARRIGKTGLIHNVFYHLQKKRGWQTIYIDIMPTENIQEFIKVFTEAVILQEHQQSKNYIKKISTLLSGINAKLSFDELTGIPTVELAYKTPQEAHKSLSQIFHYLAQQNTRYAIAIDEFQQISDYPEKNIEALLRSHIQQLTNVNFIFSGSNKRLLTAMFADHKRPFYQSTDFMYLQKIDLEVYSKFIHNKFTTYKKNIAITQIKECIEYYETHTFYVQTFFNKLFELSDKKVTKEHIETTHRLILDEREYIYYNYRKLLTPFQFQLLKALAREGGVKQLMAGDFIAKHKLSQGSSISRAAKSLIEKEMINEDNGIYYVYDIFFAKWLNRLP